MFGPERPFQYGNGLLEKVFGLSKFGLLDIGPARLFNEVATSG